MEGTFVVDFEYLVGNLGEHVVKELAIYKLAGNTKENPKQLSWIFKPPYEDCNISAETRKHNQWITENFHGLRWSDGIFQYSDFGLILKQMIPAGSRVYAKGREKAKYISEHLSLDVTDMNNLNCPESKDIWFPQFSCFFHHFHHSYDKHPEDIAPDILKCANANDKWFPTTTCFYHSANHDYKYCAVTKTLKFAVWLTNHFEKFKCKLTSCACCN